MTTAELLKELESRAKEIDKSNTFKGEGKALASVLLAGIQMMSENKEVR